MSDSLLTAHFHLTFLPWAPFVRTPWRETLHKISGGVLCCIFLLIGALEPIGRAMSAETDCASAAKLFLILCLHWTLSSERLSCSWHTFWSRIPPADSLRFYWGLAPPASLCYHCCHPDNTELSAHAPVKCLWVDGESTAHLWSELLNCLLPLQFVSSWSLLVVFFFPFCLSFKYYVG